MKRLCFCDEKPTLDVCSSSARNIKRLSERPSTARRPLTVYSTSKKPGLCCTERFLWRDAFLETML
jgi:hypothetical protein